MRKAKKDPDLYRRMSAPFLGNEEANAALDAFFEELSVIREKHRIGNVHTIVAVSALDREGQEGELISRLHLGDGLKAEAMTAYAYGSEQAERENLIVHMIAQGKRKKQ